MNLRKLRRSRTALTGRWLASFNGFMRISDLARGRVRTICGGGAIDATEGFSVFVTVMKES